MKLLVFPAWKTPDGNKVPLIKNWQELASNDPAQVDAWRKQFAHVETFMLGIPTGQVNGIVAIDIDVKKVNGWESLKAKGFDLPETLMQRTPSGGAHYLFKAAPGVHYSNSVSSKLGVDVRGDGGWIAFYHNFEGSRLAEVPTWFTQLGSKEPLKTLDVAPQGQIKVAASIVEVQLAEALDAIRNAAAGESNDTLNVQAFKVAQLVHSGSLDAKRAYDELFKAAKDRGKPDYEAQETIKSAFKGAADKPIVAPFAQGDSTVPGFIPAPPAPLERWTPRRLTKDDLMNTSMLRKPQLFQDWSTRDICITTADGGTGKTTLMLFEAVCLALGVSFLGFTCTGPGKTLFITGEDTAEKLAAMLGQIMRQMGIIDDQEKCEKILSSVIIKKDSDLTLITFDPKTRFMSLNTHALARVLEAVADFGPSKIVFDPISSFWGSEAALNDMNKAVIKFMSELVAQSGAQVEMINHMGKSSSANKDMSQFAGRGGSGLPSNSRISRVLRGLAEDEFEEMTGERLLDKQSAMLCQVNKFSDGSPLLNKPFVIVRDGHLFTRRALTPQKAKEAEKSMSDIERVFTWVKEQRAANRYPTQKIVVGHFMTCGDPIPEKRTVRTLEMLSFQSYMGERLKMVDNPDPNQRSRVYVVTDDDGEEV